MNSNNTPPETIQGICDVHRLVDKDTTLRPVKYCPMCEAYICAECENNWIKRGIAAVLNKCAKCVN